jgi:hypothetical protein
VDNYLEGQRQRGITMQAEVRGEEDVMNTRMRAEAITARIGAVALPLAITLFVVSTHAHPSGDVMDNPTIFMEYARDDSWIAVHFVQWFAALLLISGLVALYYSITPKPEAAAGVVRFGLAAAVLTAGSFTMLQAVDGVALKWAVDAWASAPADQEAAAFAAAEALRWTELSLQSYSNILLGLTLILYGLAIAVGTVYPRWLGWIAAGSGVAWIVHGLMVPYIGFFDSVPRLVAIVLLAVWAFVMAFLMWRNGNRGRIARHGSTKPSASPR